MANKKWKLSDGDLWATDGVYDFGQSKTQRQINADLIQADSDLNGAISDINKLTTTETINFDTETRSLVYFGITASTGTKPPLSQNGYLITIVRDASNAVVQFAFQNASDSVIYTRKKISGTWTSWGSIKPNSESVTITPNATNTSSGRTSISCRKSGNVVSVSGTIEFSQTVSTNTELASGFPAPSANTSFLAFATADYGVDPVNVIFQPIRLAVTTGGKLVPWYNVSSTYLKNGVYLLVNATYII